LNAGVSYFGVHNSSIGWYSVATPAISYTFNEHYSTDVSASVYLHRMVQDLDPGAPPGQLKLDSVDAGDTFIGFHASYDPEYFQNTISASLSLPSGDSSEGLGTGRVGFDFTNHTVRYFKRVGFLVDIGAGNTSTLSNDIVTKNYSSSGALAHFQAGTIFWMKGSYLETSAYEQLPIGSQTVYSSAPPPGPGSSSPPPSSSTSASEDNGLTVVIGIPITGTLTAVSYYNRSLRQHSDTVSLGVTYVLRGSRRRKWLSMIDRALREAETEKP